MIEVSTPSAATDVPSDSPGVETSLFSRLALALADPLPKQRRLVSAGVALIDEGSERRAPRPSCGRSVISELGASERPWESSLISRVIEQMPVRYAIARELPVRLC